MGADAAAPNGNGGGGGSGSGSGSAKGRAKLHGRAFYESIGSPKFVLAPMVEQSEFVCPTGCSHFH